MADNTSGWGTSDSQGTSQASEQAQAESRARLLGIVAAGLGLLSARAPRGERMTGAQAIGEAGTTGLNTYLGAESDIAQSQAERAKMGMAQQELGLKRQEVGSEVAYRQAQTMEMQRLSRPIGTEAAARFKGTPLEKFVDPEMSYEDFQGLRKSYLTGTLARERTTPDYKAWTYPDGTPHALDKFTKPPDGSVPYSKPKKGQWVIPEGATTPVYVDEGEEPPKNSRPYSPAADKPKGPAKPYKGTFLDPAGNPWDVPYDLNTGEPMSDGMPQKGVTYKSLMGLGSALSPPKRESIPKLTMPELNARRAEAGLEPLSAGAAALAGGKNSAAISPMVEPPRPPDVPAGATWGHSPSMGWGWGGKGIPFHPAPASAVASASTAAATPAGAPTPTSMGTPSPTAAPPPTNIPTPSPTPSGTPSPVATPSPTASPALFPPTAEPTLFGPGAAATPAPAATVAPSPTATAAATEAGKPAPVGHLEPYKVKGRQQHVAKTGELAFVDANGSVWAATDPVAGPFRLLRTGRGKANARSD